jgi:isoleucyl-tRNA synthetase
VISVLQSLIADVNREMEGYRLYNVVPRLVHFIDDLTNWYVRRSRPRFWKSDDDADKANAYATLYDVLVTFTKVLAPFMPFITETAYQRLVRPLDASAPASVHFSDYPMASAGLIDTGLEESMRVARDVVALGRKLREEHRIRVRQPLRRLTVVHRDPERRAMALASQALIADELNLKNVAVEADEGSFTSIAVKPNFKTLGKRCGPKLKPIGTELAGWGFAEVARLEAGEKIEVEGVALALDDVILQRSALAGAAVATNGELTVVLDTEIDPVLRREGIAREFVSVLQNARKQAGLEVADRIRVSWSCQEAEIRAAFGEHADAIAREVLAVQFAEGPTRDSSRLNEHDVGFALDKV